MATSPSRSDTHVIQAVQASPGGTRGQPTFLRKHVLRWRVDWGGVAGDPSVLSDDWRTASAREGWLESRDGSFRPVTWARTAVPATGVDEKLGEPFPPILGWREPHHLLGLPSRPWSFCDVAVGLGDVRGLWLKSYGLLLFIDLVSILERMWLYLLSAPRTISRDVD